MKGCFTAVLLMLAACSSTSGVPGSDVVGTFLVTAEPVERQCALTDVPGQTFDFQATVSRLPSTGEAWLTLRGYPRTADYDGQLVNSEASAARTFAECTGCETHLYESLNLAVFSESQTGAVGGACPENPLDGGVPAANSDLGILKPGRGQGAEPLIVCGDMITTIHSSNLCPNCEGCFVRYRLHGTRQ